LIGWLGRYHVTKGAEDERLANKKEDFSQMKSLPQLIPSLPNYSKI
jgi:hypothetical protein